MHFEESTAPAPSGDGPWYKQLNRYHWFVLAVCSLGWLFDTMDQQLFNLARPAAMRELIPDVGKTSPEDAKELGKILKRHPWKIIDHPRDRK